jgi:putative membrane protein
MMYYDHDVSGWGWVGMTIGMILFWGLLIVVVLFAARVLTRAPDQGNRSSGPSAEELLAERFARGEIDDEEYRKRLTTLRAHDRHPTP